MPRPATATAALPGRPHLWMGVLGLGLAGCTIRASDLQEWSAPGGYDDSPLALAIVLDNSCSMAERVPALARALPALDAARGDRELRVVALSASVEFTRGWTGGIDPGEAGLPIAAARSSDDPDWVVGLTRDLLCDLSSWRVSALPNDASYVCDPGAPALPSVVSVEYLDCLCGAGAWPDNPEGSGREEPLEAVLLLGCRSAPDPPDACFDPRAPFAETADLMVTDWPGDDVRQTHALVVSDEGDDSRRIEAGEDTSDAYLETFATLPVPPTISGIGLPVDPQTGAAQCTDIPSPAWSIDRILDAAAQTGGGYWPLAEETDGRDCVPADLVPALMEWVTSRRP